MFQELLFVNWVINHSFRPSLKGDALFKHSFLRCSMELMAGLLVCGAGGCLVWSPVAAIDLSIDLLVY